MKSILADKGARLFIILGGFFMTNALIAEFIGMKIFALEDTLGIAPFNWNLFGQEGSLQFSAGVLLWPVVFVTTDIINEYYGQKGVKLLSWMAVGLIAYAFVMVYFAIILKPASWWVEVSVDQGVPDLQKAFANIYGQSNWIIVGSLVAFLFGQLVDSFVFQKIKRFTGEGKVWLRATGSTLISQCIDSFVVLYIAFVIGPQQWSMSQFFAIGTVNYSYKFLMAVALTPLIYLAHMGIDRYLGKKLAAKMKKSALQTNS